MLDHALFYCIGVNLPTHHIGQLDRVLVVASPINDVNLHAWNLNRVKRFLVIEAGIQMELCGNCMGHRKNTVTFLISPEFINDCVQFLVREAKLSEEPQQIFKGGPLLYSLSHNCSLVSASSECKSSSPVYTNAEMVVLGKKWNEQSEVGLYINCDFRTRGFSRSSSVSQYDRKKEKATLAPPLPPKGMERPGDMCNPKLDKTEYEKQNERHFNERPYQINHRIYVSESGTVKKDSHVFGSGSWKRSGHNPPVVPPRHDSGSKFHPVYVQETDIHTPTLAHQQKFQFQRPEFIGDRPPCLPPRGIHDSPTLTKRSISDSNLIESSSSPSLSRRNSEHPKVHYTERDSPPLLPVSAHTFTQSFGYQNVSHGHNFIRNEVQNRSPSPDLCTDDVTNAEFSLVTKLTFTDHVLPPRNLMRSPRRPVPLPRSKKPDAAFTVDNSADNTCEPSPARLDGNRTFECFSPNPIYSLVGKERESSSSSGSSESNTPLHEKRITSQNRSHSLSSSSLGSEDYKKHAGKADVVIKRVHSNEIIKNAC